MSSRKTIKVAELFAGVGGFRLGLDGYHDPEHPEFDLPAAGPFETVWANQWEPPGTEAKQFSARCYAKRFHDGTLVNEDINRVLDEYEAGEIDILVGTHALIQQGVRFPDLRLAVVDEQHRFGVNQRREVKPIEA